MRRSVLILVTVWVSVLYSCTERNVTNEVKFSKRDNVKMSELISDYSLIRLETCDDNLILDVSMLRILNNRIFVLDCFSQSKGIYAFDMKGNYLGKVGAWGQGPGEYIMPMQIVTDSMNGMLIVKDVAQNKLLCYDAESCRFVKEVPLSFYSDCVEYAGTDKLVWYVGAGCNNKGDYQNHIQITDMEARSLGSGVARMNLPKRGLYNVMTLFHQYAGETYFKHPFSNEVYKYHVESNEAELSYSLTWEGLHFPDKAFVTENVENIVQALKEKNYIGYYDLLENSEKLLTYMGDNQNRYVGVYDKKKQIGFYCDIDRVEDDLGILKYNRPKTVYNDYFVSVIYTENLEDVPANSIIASLLQGEVDGGNPIVVLYK